MRLRLRESVTVRGMEEMTISDVDGIEMEWGQFGVLVTVNGKLMLVPWDNIRSMDAMVVSTRPMLVGKFTTNPPTDPPAEAPKSAEQSKKGKR